LLQVQLLSPLQQLCAITHVDVRQRQLECVLQILQNNAEQLSDGWPLVLGVIGDVANGQGSVFGILMFTVIFWLTE